jgi:hypothetical protein
MDRPDNTSLERLDRLGAATRNDLAGRDSDNIHGAEARPGDCNAENGYDGESNGAADRRRWGLHDLQRGWEKGKFVLATLLAFFWKGDNVFSGLHGALPGADIGSHIGRRS